MSTRHGREAKPNLRNHPKAYSYLRFSTPEQARGDSYRRQTALAEEYALRHGLDLDDRLTFRDLGVSAYRGRNVAEGRLADFLDGVRSGDIERGSFLLVESLDRISRQTARKALRTLESIVEEGVTVVTLSDGKQYTEESLDADPMALIMSILIFARANEESTTKARRLKAAWENKRKSVGKKPLTARTPAWITLTNGKLVADPRKAAVVRRVFSMAAKGIGQEAIARKLNADGVRTFGKAKHWQKSYVAKLIGNPAVVGDLVPHVIDYTSGRKTRKPLEPVPGYFPPVIDRDTFNALQRPPVALTGSADGSLNGTTRRPKGMIRNMLAGLARCPVCGGTMTRVMKGNGVKGGRPKLVCAKAKAGGGCQYRAVDLGRVEEAILDNLDYLLGSMPSGSRGLDKAISDTETALSVLRDQAAELAEEIASGNRSEAVRVKLATIEAEIGTLEEREKLLLGRAAEASPASLGKRMEEVEVAAKALRRGDDRSRLNTALRGLWAGVTVDWRRGEVIVTWRHGGESRATYAMPIE